MLLRRFYHESLAQASYMVGCQRTGEALIVDPNRLIDQYIEAAEHEGLRITAITETHIHADFVSGARALAARTRATLYLSDEGPAEWKYAFADASNAVLVRDGDHFMIGNVRIDVIHTPGHTPEHLSFLLTDTAASIRPMGIFTGDFVFVGDVGRPDLLEKAAGIANTMEAGARTLFASLARFREMPDYLQVWPAHGAGSACGKALGAVTQSTVGYEKLVGWAFQSRSEDEFVSAILDGQPDPPRYFAQMKRINKIGPAPRPADLPAVLPTRQIIQELDAGTIIVDTRCADEFARAHIPGTLSIPAGSEFLTWAGWLLPYDRPFALIADDGSLPSVMDDLAAIGLDNVAGRWRPDVVEAWQGDGHETATFTRAVSTEVRPIIEPNGVFILDVRMVSEYAEGHIPGSHNIPLGQLTSRLAEIPTKPPTIVTCQSGGRSPIAAGLLQASGRMRVIEMKDGMSGWQANHYPVE
ncbi:MAG: rhodanese-like domain-containing protein [Anaerolineae bacterium]